MCSLHQLCNTTYIILQLNLALEENKEFEIDLHSAVEFVEQDPMRTFRGKI